MMLRSAAALALLSLPTLFCPLWGCGSRDEGKPAPITQADQIQQIQNNPNMSPEQKQAALDNIRAHQQVSSSIGQARQKSGTKSPQTQNK